MQHPSKLYVDPAHQPAAFAACAFLADHLHAHARGRPLVLIPAILTTIDGAQPCVLVRVDDTGQTLGYAVVGEPPLANHLQRQKLEAALETLRPGRKMGSAA